LKDGTPLKEVIAFDEKVFLRHDLDGFGGDARFVQNLYANKMFSKFRSAIAGLYAWRAENAATADEKVRMARAADFAFRQALALCAYSPEAAPRYEAFLKGQHREADAKMVHALADHFKLKTASAPTPARASVFQVRLALEVPTDNTEPMRLVSQPGSQAQAEPMYVAKTVLLDEASIQSAQLGKSPQGNPEINISLTDTGRKQFAEITREHLHQRLGIVMDGKLWEAPVIQTEITGGKAQVSGNFGEEEASQLVARINDAAAK
jgi:hypothetical protein